VGDVAPANRDRLLARGYLSRLRTVARQHAPNERMVDPKGMVRNWSLSRTLCTQSPFGMTGMTDFSGVPGKPFRFVM